MLDTECFIAKLVVRLEVFFQTLVIDWLLILQLLRFANCINCSCVEAKVFKDFSMRPVRL